MCLSAWIVDSGQWTGAFGTQINFYLSAARAALQRDEVVQRCYELTVLRYGQDHARKDHHDLRNPRLFLLFLAQAAMYIFFFFLIPKRGTIHLVVQSILNSQRMLCQQ